MIELVLRLLTNLFYPRQLQTGDSGRANGFSPNCFNFKVKMYEQLETLLIAMDGGFLIKLRMQDIFDDTQLTEIKLTLTEVLKQNQQYGTVPIQLLPLLVDTFLYLSSMLDISKHSERISYAIDDLSAIIREFSSTGNGNLLST